MEALILIFIRSAMESTAEAFKKQKIKATQRRDNAIPPSPRLIYVHEWPKNTVIFEESKISK